MSVLVWAGDALTQVPEGEEPHGEVMACDSWLVEHGRVRALDHHQDRFFTALTGVVPAEDLARFWSSAIAGTPRRGEFFPKVEALSTPGGVVLTLALRPAPPRTDHVQVWAPGITDPRMAPGIKGPDLAGLVALRQRGRGHGCDETLLQAPDGAAVEAANSSLMWWEGDVFCIPDSSLPTLPGVTRGLVLEEVRRRKIAVRECRAAPADLLGNEVWLTSALQGIRPVTGWVMPDGGDAPAVVTPAAPAPRAAAWREWLAGAACPLPPRE